MVGVARGKRLIKQIIRSQRLPKISGEGSYIGKIVVRLIAGLVP